MKNAFKIVVLGSPQVGKSTIINEAIESNPYRLNMPYEPTIEDIYYAVAKFDNQQQENLFFYDYSGIVPPLNLETIKMYLSFCDAFLLVFAVNDKNSFSMVVQIKKSIDKLKDKKDIPILIVANKIDKINEFVVNLEEIKKWALQEKVTFIEMTATNRRTIVDCFLYLTSKLASFSKSSRKSKTGSLQLEL